MIVREGRPGRPVSFKFSLLRASVAGWGPRASLDIPVKFKNFRLERLDQAILEVIDNPEKTQQTTAIETLF